MTPSRPYEISKMMHTDAWEDPRGFLAEQLSKGRLALVLGAGISFGFGLPTWDALVNDVAELLGAVRKPDISNEDFAEDLWRLSGSKNLEFSETVRKCLYKRFNSSVDDICSHRLLASIGALARPAKRGSVAHIITFNFDNLIETYLEYYGIQVQPIATLPTWDSNLYDVTILHPHGLLPLDSRDAVTPIVFTKLDFQRIIGETKNKWRTRMGAILNSNTCLFLGLSGEDENLMGLASETKNTHVSSSRQDCYWGVRITATNGSSVVSANSLSAATMIFQNF